MVDATIHGLDRGTIRSDTNALLEASSVATRSDPNPDLELGAEPVYNLVIEHPEATILWDTGSHHEAASGHWPAGLYDAFPHEDAVDHRLDDDLESIGFGIEDIDCVVLTHLHVDHAGGLEFFAGTDVPVFVHERELQFAYYSVVSGEGDGGYVRADFDHDLDWTIVHGDRERHFADVELVRWPGHTPGTMGMVIHLERLSLVFTSDLAMVRENWKREHPPGHGLTWNREDWFDSLHGAKDLVRRHDAEVVFGHDPDQHETVLAGWP